MPEKPIIPAQPFIEAQRPRSDMPATSANADQLPGPAEPVLGDTATAGPSVASGAAANAAGSAQQAKPRTDWKLQYRGR